MEVPRAQLATWWPRPWADVISAAERGEDGLTVVHVPPGSRAVLPDVAWLREGVGEPFDDAWGKNRTLLYHQNW